MFVFMFGFILVPLIWNLVLAFHQDSFVFSM